jgi:hypothetical protein
MKSYTYLHSIFALAIHISNVPEAFSAKPVHQLVITHGDFDTQLRILLGDLQLQLYQTNDPSHALKLTPSFLVCVPATEARKNACRTDCRNLEAICQ